MQVTSKTGKQIELTINSTHTGIDAHIGAIKFGTTQTATGFKSTFLVREFGSTRVEAILEGTELTKANALYAELHDAIARRNAAQDEYQSNYDRVVRGMSE